MSYQTMHRQRKLILIAAVVGIISVFLPWITISIFGLSESINGFHGWGILVFMLYVAAAVITCLGSRAQALEKNLWLLVIACGVIALFAVIIEITSSSGGLGEEPGFADADFGIGVWLTIAASASIVLFAWIFKNPANDLKNGLDGFKKSISIPSTSFPNSNTTSMNSRAQSKIDEFEKISRLKNNGSISEEEYHQLKSKLI